MELLLWSMKKAYIYNLGCKLRLLDAKLMREYLLKNKFKTTDNPKNADVIIVFTCGANNESTVFGLNVIKKFKNYDAELIVGGCIPGIDKEKLDEVFKGKSISSKDLDKNQEKVDLLFPKNKIKFCEVEEKSGPLSNFIDLEETGFKRVLKRNIAKNFKMNHIFLQLRYIFMNNLMEENSLYAEMISKDDPYPIRISWGCMGKCAYCAIKRAVGKFHSKPKEQILKDFKEGIRNNYSNFFLTSDDTGAYGLDNNCNLADLLYDMTAEKGNYRISLINLHPTWINKYIEDFEIILKRNKIKLLDVPIQSGSARILKLMRRFSNIQKMKNDLIRLKKSCPDISLNAHVIVGLPTETREELNQSLEFIKDINFSSGGIFPFSCKENTLAETFEPKISREEINNRVKYSIDFLKKNGYSVVQFDHPNYVFYK